MAMSHCASIVCRVVQGGDHGPADTLLRTLWLAAIAAHTVSTHAVASDYPKIPVRIIAAIPPGSANDVIARVLAQRLSEICGKQFIVENMPGAGGAIGTGAAARAGADGYTLLIMNQDFVILAVGEIQRAL